MAENTVEHKIKRNNSSLGHLDPHHIQNITTLNDSVICEAVKERDSSSAFTLLQQLEHSIKVGRFVYRMGTMAPTLPARNIIIITSMSAIITPHFCTRIRHKIPRPGIPWSRPLKPTRRYKGLSLAGKKISSLRGSSPRFFFSIVDFSRIAICISKSRKASGVSRTGRKRTRQGDWEC